MKFALLYEVEVLRPWGPTSQADAFWEAIEQITVADEVGFDVVWAVEHHFLDEFSLSSAPEVWLAAAAQHTERIRIGHGVVLLPFGYNHPIRVAERTATLDIVSRGRLEVGTGRSITRIEMEAFGVDPARTRAEWDEALRMLPRMWTEERFSWDSELIRVPERVIVPKPVQDPHPPLWVSGTQPATATIAGERGIGFMHFSLSDPTDLAGKVRSYREAIERAEPVGRFVNNQFAAFTIMFCGEDDADALRRAGPSVEWYTNATELLYSMWTDGDDQSYAWYARHHATHGTRAADAARMAAEHIVCVGGPERCRETVEWYASQGVDMLIFLVQCGRLDHAAICESLRRFGAEVIDPLRATGVG